MFTTNISLDPVVVHSRQAFISGTKEAPLFGGNGTRSVTSRLAAFTLFLSVKWDRCLFVYMTFKQVYKWIFIEEIYWEIDVSQIDKGRELEARLLWGGK